MYCTLNAPPDMERIEEQFANLNIVKRSSGTTEPTYLLGIDASKTVQAEKESLIAVLCSNGSIRIYDKERLYILREFRGYPGLLNGVKFANSCDSIYSSCTDGTVKRWDARSASEKPVQLFKGYPSNIFISFDISCNDHVICAGTEKVDDDALLVFWDARINSQDLSTSKDPRGTEICLVNLVHHHAGRKTCVSPDTTFQGFPTSFHQGLACCEEFHHEASMALNTQQGICHQDESWDPAWENCPRT